MKKMKIIAIIALFGYCGFAQVYEQSTPSMAATVSAVSVTNTSTEGFVWTIGSVYGVLGGAAANADTLVVSKALAAAPTVFYPIAAASIASNATYAIIVPTGVAVVEPGDIIKYTRGTTTTNVTLSILTEYESKK